MPKLSFPPSKFQISLASKMIPSPDWIVGVSKETLCEENWQDKHFFGKNGEGETIEQYFFLQHLGQLQDLRPGAR